MAILYPLYLFLILLGSYIIFKEDIINLLIRKQNFKCIRCGSCCKLSVKLTKGDISSIRSKTKMDFIEYRKGVPYLMRKNNYCVFLSLDRGVAKCKIYKYRPKICRNFPKIKSLGITAWDHRCHSFKKLIA